MLVVNCTKHFFIEIARCGRVASQAVVGSAVTRYRAVPCRNDLLGESIFDASSPAVNVCRLRVQLVVSRGCSGRKRRAHRAAAFLACRAVPARWSSLRSNALQQAIVCNIARRGGDGATARSRLEEPRLACSVTVVVHLVRSSPLLPNCFSLPLLVASFSADEAPLWAAVYYTLLCAAS